MDWWELDTDCKILCLISNLYLSVHYHKRFFTFRVYEILYNTNNWFKIISINSLF